MTSGNLDRAIRQRWTDAGLHAAFKAYWSDPLDTRFSPFNFQEARASQGAAYMPYCVFVSLGGPTLGRSTGKQAEPGYEIEYRTIAARFTIHANEYQPTVGPKQSGKEVCEALGLLLVAAYQDSAGPLPMENGDCHVQTIVGQDVCDRNDDDVWQWVFPFDFQIERRRAIRTDV